jgi:hypothetical protein
MLKRIIKQRNWEDGLDLSGSWSEIVADSCEDVNETLGYMKGREFIH